MLTVSMVILAIFIHLSHRYCSKVDH